MIILVSRCHYTPKFWFFSHKTAACFVFLLRVIFNLGISFQTQAKTKLSSAISLKTKTSIRTDEVTQLASFLFENHKCFVNGKKLIGKCKRYRNKPKVLLNKLSPLIKKALAELETKQKPNAEFSQIKVENAVKKVFGESVFQMNVGHQNIHLILQKKLGKGSFNKVLLAFDITNRKRLAFRTLINPDNSRYLEKLRKEYKLHQALSKDPILKKGIIKVHKLFFKYPFYGALLDYADKGTLENAIDSQSLTSAEKRAILLSACAFVNSIHQKDLVVGDLKADNILLKTSKKSGTAIKFGDLGGAHEVNDKTVFTITPAYMAPEVHSTFQTTKFSDAWSFGMLMYRLKYQTQPKVNDVPLFVSESLKIVNYYKDATFKDRSKIKELQDYVEESLTKLETFLDLSNPYDRIISKLLKFRPEKRIPFSKLLIKLQRARFRI